MAAWSGNAVVESELGQHLPQIVDMQTGGETPMATKTNRALTSVAGLVV